MVIRRKFYSSFGILVFLYSILVSQQSTVVAHIDTLYQITIADVQQYVYEYHFHRLYKPLANGYRAALEQLLVKRLKILDFFAKQLDKDTAILSSLKYTLTEELINEYYRSQYYEKYINETAARDLYYKTGREVSYCQVTFPKDSTVDKKVIDSLRIRVKTIKDCMEKGEDCYSILQLYGREGKDDFQRVLTLNFDEAYTDPIKRLIFQLPPKTIQLVEDEKALYIVKVLHVQEHQLQPFEVIRAKLYQVLEILYVPRALAEFEREVQNLFNNKTLRWNRKAVKRLLQWYKLSGGDEQKYGTLISKVLNKGENFTILQTSHGSVDLKKYYFFLKNIQPFNKPSTIQEDNLQKYIVESFQKALITLKARKIGLEKRLYQAFTNNYVLIDEIVKKYDEVFVEKKIPYPTISALRQFYEERKDSMYYQLAKVNLYVALAQDTTSISEFKARLAKGIPFEKVDSRVYVKRYIRNRDGSIRGENPNDPADIGVIAFQMSLNEIAGPVVYRDLEKGELFGLVKCVYKEEERQLQFEEIQDKIRKDYFTFFRELINSQTIEYLKKQYNVKVYYDTLEEALILIGVAK